MTILAGLVGKVIIFVFYMSLLSEFLCTHNEYV